MGLYTERRTGRACATYSVGRSQAAVVCLFASFVSICHLLRPVQFSFVAATFGIYCQVENTILRRPCSGGLVDDQAAVRAGTVAFVGSSDAILFCAAKSVTTYSYNSVHLPPYC
jgi:hypothetical protein